MARPLRIEYEGAHYHVTSRGNERKAIFRGDVDREKYLELIRWAVDQFDLRLHAYVLMDNHYHLLIETRRAGLNRALRYLNGVYTQAFNRRHKRVGHLFHGRYKAILVEKDSYLLELSRWSSLGAYVGTRPVPSWLTVKDVLRHFGNKEKRGYRKFIAEGIKGGIRTPWDDVRGQAVLGSEEFIEEILSRHAVGKGKKTQVVRRRELIGISPEAIMAMVGKYYGIEPEEMKDRGQRYTEPRYVASYLMRRHGLLGLREIGERVGLHLSGVGNAIQRVTDRPTRTMAKSLKELERKFKNQES
jgi:putative transposase